MSKEKKSGNFKKIYCNKPTAIKSSSFLTQWIRLIDVCFLKIISNYYGVLGPEKIYYYY
jgi:hypothetical protein